MDCLFHIFFELFKKALLFGLGVVAAVFQLAQELLLLFCQLRRRFDHDSDKLVAARLIPDIRNALAAQTECGSRLCALGDVVADLAI